MTCKTLAGRAEHTSSRTSPSPRGGIDPGSTQGQNGWIPGQARNDVGVGMFCCRRCSFLARRQRGEVAVTRTGFRVKPGMTWVWGCFAVVDAALDASIPLYLRSKPPPEILPCCLRAMFGGGQGGIFARVNMPSYKRAYEKNGVLGKNFQEAPKTCLRRLFRSLRRRVGEK